MNWNAKEAEAALAGGAALKEALQLGLPFADQLLALARGDQDLVQAVWVWAMETEMGAPDHPEMGAPESLDEAPTYIGKAVVRNLDDSLTLLKKGMRKLRSKERKSNNARRKLESSWAYVTSKGENGWP